MFTFHWTSTLDNFCGYHTYNDKWFTLVMLSEYMNTILVEFKKWMKKTGMPLVDQVKQNKNN